MPSRVTNRTLSREEQRFIDRFVKAGGDRARVSECERLAKLKSGEGAKMLKRAHVLEEIERRLEPVHLEQVRQQLVGEAVAIVIAKLAEEKLKAELEAKAAAAEVDALISAPRMTVNTDDLEHELMRLAKHLDMDRHPQVKLQAIQAAFVVSGVLENGNVRRVIPKTPPGGDSPFSNPMYGDLFDRMHAARENPGGPPTIDGEAKVFDLVPREEPAATGADLPPAGEEIERINEGEEVPEPKPRADRETIKRRVRALTHPKVMTVDAG